MFYSNQQSVFVMFQGKLLCKHETEPWILVMMFLCVLAQIRELEPVLCPPGRTSQLIWTSSSNAHRSAFSLEDIQHRRGTQPYSSSKYASDLLNLALNTHYNKQVDSHTSHMLRVTCDVNFCPKMLQIVLLCRVCTHLWSALVLWWPIWPTASFPPSQHSSGVC